MFLSLFGSGEIKIFGGEPLLEPELVREVLDYVREEDRIKSVYLSTNGLGLDSDWMDYLKAYPKAILTISMDGLPADHRKLRRALPGVRDSYEHINSLLPQLHSVPRLVLTQTIAPATARNALANFRHLRTLGFRRFNFLPGYFIPWRDGQLRELRSNFSDIRQEIQADWERGKHVYVRNLFVRAPTPFFNQGLIVDSDETIHPCNVGLSGSLDHLRGQTQVGSLSDPPTVELLKSRAAGMNDLIQSAVPEKIWKSTLAADAELTRFCTELYPAFVAYRKKKGSAA